VKTEPTPEELKKIKEQRLKDKKLKEVKQSYIDLIQDISDDLAVELNNENKT